MLSPKGLSTAGLLAVALSTLSACGNGEPGPTAAPDAVVAAAPDATFATGSASVATAAPGVTATGRARFADTRVDLAVAPPRAPTPFGVRQPIAVVDLLRGAVHVRPYGGAEVQGIGTKRYELIVDVGRAVRATPQRRRGPLETLSGQVGGDGELWADVFVDAQGRIRRALVPVDLASDRPFGRDKSIPAFVSVDFYEFGDTS